MAMVAPPKNGRISRASVRHAPWAVCEQCDQSSGRKRSGVRPARSHAVFVDIRGR